MTCLARSPRYGLDKQSAREPLASNYYQHKIPVTKKQHAIIRIRKLFAASLGYDSPITLIDYNIAPPNLPSQPPLNLSATLLGGSNPTRDTTKSHRAIALGEPNRIGIS